MNVIPSHFGFQHQQGYNDGGSAGVPSFQGMRPTVSIASDHKAYPGAAFDSYLSPSQSYLTNHQGYQDLVNGPWMSPASTLTGSRVAGPWEYERSQRSGFSEPAETGYGFPIPSDCIGNLGRLLRAKYEQALPDKTESTLIRRIIERTIMTHAETLKTFRLSVQSKFKIKQPESSVFLTQIKDVERKLRMCSRPFMGETGIDWSEERQILERRVRDIEAILTTGRRTLSSLTPSATGSSDLRKRERRRPLDTTAVTDGRSFKIRKPSSKTRTQGSIIASNLSQLGAGTRITDRQATLPALNPNHGIPVQNAAWSCRDQGGRPPMLPFMTQSELTNNWANFSNYSNDSVPIGCNYMSLDGASSTSRIPDHIGQGASGFYGRHPYSVPQADLRIHPEIHWTPSAQTQYEMAPHPFLYPEPTELA